MTQKRLTTTDVDDLAEAIQSLATMMGAGFERVEAAQAETNHRLTKVETGLAETNHRLLVVEEDVRDIKRTVHNIDDDIRTLYREVGAVKKTAKATRVVANDLQKRIDRLDEFAKRVARQTGIPFTG